MADDTDADVPDDDDDGQDDKNQSLKTRAQASWLGSQQRQQKPGSQALLARARRGRDMTPDATDESKKVGGFSKKAAVLYDNSK